MAISLAQILVAATLCAAATSSAARAAQTLPAPQHVLSRGAPDAAGVRPIPASLHDHLFYGRIDALHGNVLEVRSRSGRLQQVDYGEALRSGAYSEPIFIGKLVVVRGYYDASRILHAHSVMRIGALDASMGP